jgi:hypothetical protein
VAQLMGRGVMGLIRSVMTYVQEKGPRDQVFLKQACGCSWVVCGLHGHPGRCC